MHLLRSSLVAVVVLFLSGCRDEVIAPRPEVIPARGGNGIVIMPDSFSSRVLRLADTVRLVAARRDTAGDVMPGDTGKFLWESSDTTILVVYPDGLVRVVGLGSATIRARLADSIAPTLPSAADTSVGELTLRSSYTVIDSGPVQSAALSRAHQCLIRTDGALFCRGTNNHGQLGIGYISAAPVPDWTQVAPGQTFRSVATSSSHTCALRSDRRAFCWGENTYGQLGFSRTVPPWAYVPTELPGATEWLNVDAGGHSATCAVRADNVPYCAGHNDWGQTGRSRAHVDSIFAPVSGDHRMTMILTRDFYTCGLEVTGAVYCSGEGGPSTNTTSTLQTYVPNRIGGSVPFTSIAIGEYHGCGLDASNQAWCWGRNGNGQLGTGDLTASGTARAVLGGLAFQMLHTSDTSTCGLTLEGEIYCWGTSYYGAFARMNIRGSLTPLKLPLGTGNKWVGATDRWGVAPMCAINASSQLICWGGGK